MDWWKETCVCGLRWMVCGEALLSASNGCSPNSTALLADSAAERVSQAGSSLGASRTFGRIIERAVGTTEPPWMTSAIDCSGFPSSGEEPLVLTARGIFADSAADGGEFGDA